MRWQTITYRKNMVDRIDEIIISALSQDARQSTFELCDRVRQFKYRVTEEEVESRKQALEDSGIIKGYTISVDTKKLPGRVIRVDLVTFRTSQALQKRLKGLKRYLQDAPFVAFSGRTRGGYDWITIKSFLSAEMADEENDIYRNLFGDILQTYEVYDFIPQSEALLYSMSYTGKEYQEFLKEWFPPFIGK